ncbi:transcription factor HES-5-like [Hemibagrus wyckioides]|nr:transcription factor HES-5-like [Hemibagrus wyckioides]
MWQPYIPHCVSKLSHWLQTVRTSNKPKTHTFIWRFGSINRGAAASTNQTHSTQRDLQHRDTAMAPTITSALNISNEHLPLNNKLRKPMVEKMRRDRINSSIEQLKSLLAPEFLNQQPDSKLEKADILEMTVSFLRQKQQQQQPAFSSSSTAVNQGFSRCVHDIVHFLSKEEVKTQSQRKLLNHFQNLQPSSDENRRESVVVQLSSTEQQIISKEKSSVKSSLWRPW